jgi:hypothetical protein
MNRFFSRSNSLALTVRMEVRGHFNHKDCERTVGLLMHVLHDVPVKERELLV